MILANVKFGRCGRNSRPGLEDLIQTYLSRLLHQGQLCTDYVYAWTSGVLNAYVHLAAPKAYAVRHHSDYGKETLSKVRQAFGKYPEWTLLADDARKRSPSWHHAPFLYLHTHAFDCSSPVRRGDDGTPLPSYLFSIPYQEREMIYFWQDNYYHHEHVWLASGTLEIPAYRQLADPKSDLSQHGRQLCAEIEKVTRIPTYYYLTRYWGRRKWEDKRKCPGCGRAWRTEHPVDKRVNFWLFPFRCKKCRLVSHTADSFDDERHARVGEYRKGKH